MLDKYLPIIELSGFNPKYCIRCFPVYSNCCNLTNSKIDIKCKLSNLIELEVPEEQREVLLLNYAEKMKTKQLKSA